MPHAEEHHLADIARRRLEEAQECVRMYDYVRARELYVEDHVFFGSVVFMGVGRDAQERDQFRVAWPRFQEITFRFDEMYCFGGDQGLCIAVPLDVAPAQWDGTSARGSARATIMLMPREDRWVAVHTHFSSVRSTVPPS
jgi:ketosteroid isomerase-like protein